MSKILATDNIKTQNWSLEFSDDFSPYYADLQIGFTEDKPIVVFKKLRFGFTLTDGNNEVIDEQSYPPQGIKYTRTNQKYLVTHRLKLSPDTDYSLFLWAENADVLIEHTETFKTPIPEQPFESWTWDGEKWNPPISYPDDGLWYEWDEENGNWVLVAETEGD